MNDLEWRRQLRDLRQPQAPRRDLWAGIEQAIGTASPAHVQAAPRSPAMSRTPWLFVAGLAAVTLLAIGLGRFQPSTAPTVANLAAASTAWKPDDPRLAAAAIELGAAQLELRQAISQAPDSAGLQRLLQRTEQQQSRLRQQSHEAG